jgi:hypothetical protein
VDRKTLRGQGNSPQPSRHEIAVSFTGSRAPYRLTLTVDEGQEQDSVAVDRLTKICGEAFVGRPMPDDAEPAQHCGSAIEKVTIGNWESDLEQGTV